MSTDVIFRMPFDPICAQDSVFVLYGVNRHRVTQKQSGVSRGRAWTGFLGWSGLNHYEILE